MIYVAGSLNMDLVVSSAYMPQTGETLCGNGFFTNCGGKGANQAVAAAKLGGKVAMCGVVGNDVFGKTLAESLQNVGIGTSCVHVADDTNSGVAVIVVVNGDNRIVLDSGANGKLTKQMIDEFLTDATQEDIYITQLENPIDVVGYGLQLAKKKGMTVVLNPAPANKGVLPYLQYVDLLVPNETELALLGGYEALFGCGVKKIVATLGGDGYEICSPAERKRYSCGKVKVVDTTAAGDTFCGGMAVGLSEGMTLEQACALGSTAATLACTKKGAQQSMPLRSDVALG